MFHINMNHFKKKNNLNITYKYVKICPPGEIYLEKKYS
jgi:hypothetical protein